MKKIGGIGKSTTTSALSAAISKLQCGSFIVKKGGMVIPMLPEVNVSQI